MVASARTAPLFLLGQTVATPGAIDALAQASENWARLLSRHVAGDWGVLSESDKAENVRALRTGARILSAYMLSTGVKVWIVTEADRSSTCVLLPEEY